MANFNIQQGPILREPQLFPQYKSVAVPQRIQFGSWGRAGLFGIIFATLPVIYTNREQLCSEEFWKTRQGQLSTWWNQIKFAPGEASKVAVAVPLIQLIMRSGFRNGSTLAMRRLAANLGSLFAVVAIAPTLFRNLTGIDVISPPSVVDQIRNSAFTKLDKHDPRGTVYTRKEIETNGSLVESEFVVESNQSRLKLLSEAAAKAGFPLVDSSNRSNPVVRASIQSDEALTDAPLDSPDRSSYQLVRDASKFYEMDHMYKRNPGLRAMFFLTDTLAAFTAFPSAVLSYCWVEGGETLYQDEWRTFVHFISQRKKARQSEADKYRHAFDLLKTQHTVFSQLSDNFVNALEHSDYLNATHKQELKHLAASNVKLFSVIWNGLSKSQQDQFLAQWPKQTDQQKQQLFSFLQDYHPAQSIFDPIFSHYVDQ